MPLKALVAISKSRDWVEAEWEDQIGTWKIPSGWQVKFGKMKQFTAAERHNVAIHEAKYNYDRILFMDTDQIYPHEYLEMMLAHKEPVLSGLTVARYSPFEITTYSFVREDHSNGVVFPRFEAVHPPADKRLFECDITGTAALMIDPKILDKLPTPYFKDIYDAEGCQRLCPDDFYFGWLLYKAGLKVVVDQSIIVKHIARIMASPYNARDLRKAWDKVNSGFGYWKDGKK